MAVLLGLQEPQMGGCVCVCVCVYVIAERVGVLWHQQSYSNLFLSLIIVWSNVKPKPLLSLPVFSLFFSLSAPAERFGSRQAQHGLP